MTSTATDRGPPVPLYFFHTHEDGQDVLDELGTWLHDDQEARTQALQASGEMLKDVGGQFWSSGTWHMRVVNECGDNVCFLRLAAEAFPRRDHYAVG